MRVVREIRCNVFSRPLPVLADQLVELIVQFVRQLSLATVVRHIACNRADGDT